MNFLIVIPARAGSKGLPGKNIKKLHGKPLISYSIEAAIKSDLRLDVLVSTDGQEIADVAKKDGALVPFMRPANISDDKATSQDVLLHAVEFYENLKKLKVDWALLLQPTNPLVKSEDLNGAMKLAIKHQRKVDTIISAVEMPGHLPASLFQLESDSSVKKLFQNLKQERRQDNDSRLVKTNGSIFLVKRDYLFANRKIFSPRIAAYLMPKSRYVDIDDAEDFSIASMMLDAT
ncbi:acylneuraminate cytidylyltransferase family protein [Gammaproteobacteria bacterium]|nr:acylneuraminate cytidylyltransferase family protein [Gammaproteobacteria bacterium]